MIEGEQSYLIIIYQERMKDILNLREYDWVMKERFIDFLENMY